VTYIAAEGFCAFGCMEVTCDRRSQ